MFNKPGKLLKQQKILLSQNEHNLTILCEFPLGILLFSFSFCIICADKNEGYCKKLLSKFGFDAYFFLYKIESGINIYRFFNDKVTIFRPEGIFSSGNISESLPNKSEISKH